MTSQVPSRRYTGTLVLARPAQTLPIPHTAFLKYPSACDSLVAVSDFFNINTSATATPQADTIMPSFCMKARDKNEPSNAVTVTEGEGKASNGLAETLPMEPK